LQVDVLIFFGVKVDIFESIDVIYGCSLVEIYSIASCTCSWFRLESPVWKDLSIYSTSRPLKGHIDSLSLSVELNILEADLARWQCPWDLLHELLCLLVDSGYFIMLQLTLHLLFGHYYQFDTTPVVIVYLYEDVVGEIL
jgi:hypothetical protein